MDDMNFKNEQKILFDDFPPISAKAWEDLIIQDLKGADYERKLVWNTPEGFKVQPFYRKEDLEAIKYLDVFPGDFPFVRSGRKKENNWFVRQNIFVDDIQSANKKALDILMKGIDSLGFMLDASKTPTIEQIERLMENIYAQIVEVNFICGKQAPEVLNIYLDLIKKYNRDFQKIHGSVNFDPIGNLIIGGNFYTSEKEDFKVCAKLVQNARHLPHFRTLSVHATFFKNSGSNIVQELAFGLAYANEYLARLTAKEIPVDDIAPNIKFHYAVGSSYFLEIAKIRAARFLWAKVVNAYGPSHAGITRTHIHSVTADWNKTIYDPYVNMLRTTTEAMSAILGGANSLTVKPFNAVFEKPTDFSERIARNQQLILKEESYLDKIVDPAAGSYYIEQLTDSLIEAAWKLFLEIDDAGGFIEAFKKGIIQQQIKQNADERNKSIASRKKILVGSNQYPNFTEKLTANIEKSMMEPMDCSQENAIVETLKPYRGAQQFEQLRAKTDRHALKGKRPAAFMLTYGSLAMRRARSQFSSNFFACASFEIIDNNGFTSVDDGVIAARKSNAEIVVICAADEDYPVIAHEIFEKVKDETIVVIAGFPKDSVEELKAKGIQHFIHVKSNVLETLQSFQKLLGI
jgi:methylmalonyl-CoA mutase